MCTTNSITISPETVRIKVGEWYHGMRAETNSCVGSIRWESDDSRIVSINPTTGYIYGVGHGITNVRAVSVNGECRSNDCIVVAYVPTESVTIIPSTKQIAVGEQTSLTFALTPENSSYKKVTWCSDNPCIASVNSNGVVTANALGTSTIYATSVDGNGACGCCTVTVNPINQGDGTDIPEHSTHIYNAVLSEDGDNYIFTCELPQCNDAFTAPKDQVIGSYVTSNTDSRLGDSQTPLAYGIDVSKWNDTISQSQWNAIANTQIDGHTITFAILRIGTGDRSDKGVLSRHKDETFENNYTRAKAAGLQVGCYFYTMSYTQQEAIADAEQVIEWIGDKQFEYPIFFDIESEYIANANDLNNTDRTEMCTAFINKMREAGFFTGFYTNNNCITNHLNSSMLLPEYDFWYSRYYDYTPNDWQSSWAGTGRKFGMWQYTNLGNISPIFGDVDCNVAYKNYPLIIKSLHLNNF